MPEGDTYYELVALYNLFDSHNQPYFTECKQFKIVNLPMLESKKRAKTPCLAGSRADSLKEDWRKNMFIPPHQLCSQAAVREASWCKDEGLWEGLIFSRFSHLKVSAAKGWGFYSTKCLKLLGFSKQLDLLQNKFWPKTWLLRKTAVGWDLCIASSEVRIEQTRLG